MLTDRKIDALNRIKLEWEEVVSRICEATKLIPVVPDENLETSQQAESSTGKRKAEASGKEQSTSSKRQRVGLNIVDRGTDVVYEHTQSL
jgi:hypothetical protein